MEKTGNYKVYGYRWVILALYVVIGTAIQIMWSSFFSITIEAGEYYGFSAADADGAISLFSIIFMVGMIIFSVPSFAIFEKFGYKKSVAFGGLLTAIGGIVRGLFGENYTMVLVCTCIFALAQPFILNAVGLVAGKWFPANERATANGIGLLSNYFGIIFGLILVPILLEMGLSIKEMLLVLGIAAVVAFLLFIIFTKEAPPTPPCAEEDTARESFGKGMKALMKKKNFLFVLFAFFFFFGVFNVFFTLIEPMLQAFGGKEITPIQIGIVGVIVLIVGTIGSVVIPLLSDKDKQRRRKPYMLIGTIIGGIGISSIMFMSSYGSLAIAAAVYGLFSIGAGPVIMTFAAERAYPTSEGTSEGLLLLAGNIAGALFLILADLFSSYTSLMIAIAIMMLLSVVFLALAKEK